MSKLEKLGRYEIRKELGRGAMGIVYEAFDPVIQRVVAIKAVRKSSVDPDEADEIFTRFRREAQAAGRLSHPGIVSVYEYGEDEDTAFIVMELIHGRELKDCFDCEERFSVRDSVGILIKILDALKYSHAKGVIHRDIKPANIMIADDGQIKITDFGIAKIDSSNLTHAGVVLGTPTYMSPEQFLGQEADHRADIYAGGVILYQLLTGKRPFSGSVIAIMRQVTQLDLPPPSAANADVPGQLDEIVKKAMAKRPAERYQSADEFMAALEDLIPALPQTSRPAVKPSAVELPAVKAQEEFTLIVGDIELITPSAPPTEDERAALATQKIQRDETAGDGQPGMPAPQEEQTLRLEKVPQATPAGKPVPAAAAPTAAELARAKRAAEEKQRASARQALMEHRQAMLKNAEEKQKAAEALRLKRAAAEQQRRSRELAAFLAEHNRKFAEFVEQRKSGTVNEAPAAAPAAENKGNAG